MNLQRFSDLVEILYDAALDPVGLTRVAPLLARAFESESCFLFTRNVASGAVAILGSTDNYTEKAMADYAAHFHKVDIWADVGNKAGIGSPVVLQDYVSDAEYLASEIYNDFAAHLGIFRGLGGTMALENQTVGLFGIHRPHGTTPFENGDRRLLGLLMPHMTRAIQLHLRLSSLKHRERIGHAALDSLATGVVIVTAGGRLLFANVAAEVVLKGGEGVSIRNGVLRARDRVRDQALHRAIEQAAKAAVGHLSPPGEALHLPRLGRRPLSLLICPLRPEALSIVRTEAAALIFIGDPDNQPRTSQTVLAEIWGLTPAEARLAAALVEGERVESFADRVGISVQTARTQLKQIFAKVGCKRQSELVREALANQALRMYRE